MNVELTPDGPHVCLGCGGPMSKNPHPDAGKRAVLNEVGERFVCIPCCERRANGRAVSMAKIKSALEKERDGSNAALRKAVLPPATTAALRSRVGALDWALAVIDGREQGRRRAFRIAAHKDADKNCGKR